jgi:hypothetical protein
MVVAPEPAVKGGGALVAGAADCAFVGTSSPCADRLHVDVAAAVRWWPRRPAHAGAGSPPVWCAGSCGSGVAGLGHHARERRARRCLDRGGVLDWSGRDVSSALRRADRGCRRYRHVVVVRVLALGAVDDLREEAAPGAHGNPALGGVVDLALPAVDGASGLEVLARRRTAGRARVNSTSQSGSGAVMMTSQTSSAAAGILLLQFANQLPGLVSR